MTFLAKQLEQLGREAILAIPDIKREVVQIPEWGGAVTVQGLTGDERDDFEATCVKGRGKKTEVNLRNFRAKLVARSCSASRSSRRNSPHSLSFRDEMLRSSRSGSRIPSSRASWNAKYRAGRSVSFLRVPRDLRP